MAKNKLDRILQSKNKDVDKTFGQNGVLSRMWRGMLLDLGITIPRFSALMQDYITDSRHAIPNNKKDQTSERGNLTKEFSKPQMTWKVFCKAMRFLQITRINFSMECFHANGRITLHSTPINFGTRQETPQFLELLEQPQEEEKQVYVQCLDNELIDMEPDNEGEVNWRAVITERYYFGYGTDYDMVTGGMKKSNIPLYGNTPNAVITQQHKN